MAVSLCAIGGDRHPPAEPVVCLQCRLRHRINLDWIGRSYGLLSDHLEPGGTVDTIRTVPGSKPPLRTDVLSMESKGGVSGLLGSWVQLLVEDRAADPPNYRLGQRWLVQEQIKLLTAHGTWLIEQAFATEMVLEISQIRDEMRALLGENERRYLPIPGRHLCPVETDQGRCGTMLKQDMIDNVIRCHDCGSSWGPMSFLLLGRMLREEEMTA